MLVFAGGQPAHAATITVNTTVDELNANGNCSLREAIQAANSDTAVDACAAGSGADIIVLPAGLYTLSIGGSGEDFNDTGDLDIAGDVTINGAGAATTIIHQDRMDRVFDINAPATVVAISGLTIRNGRPPGSSGGGSGGGIRNDGTLTLTSSAVSGNSACGTCQGGGIRNNGTLTVTNSTISGNSAGSNGGGIENNAGTLTVTNSTISGNSSGASGGGIDNKDTATVANSTISGNADSQSGEGGGGAIRNAGGGAVASLKNTIVANSMPSGTNCSGSITSQGHNLSSDGSCATSFTASGDLNNTDPELGLLANNGGPTQTHGLLAGSPAIDTGSPDCPPPPSDQRGVTRPQDGDGNGSAVCDIGAYESCPGGDTDGDGISDACDPDDDDDSLGIDAAQSGGGCDSGGVAQPRFRDCIELFVGTDPLDPCANTATADDEATDKMPADLNDDQVVNVTDRTLMTVVIKNYAGGAGVYNARYDLNASGTLNVTDRTIVVLYIKLTGSVACTP